MNRQNHRRPHRHCRPHRAGALFSQVTPSCFIQRSGGTGQICPNSSYNSRRSSIWGSTSREHEDRPGIDRSNLPKEATGRYSLSRLHRHRESHQRLGVAEPKPQKQGKDRIIVELPGFRDEGAASRCRLYRTTRIQSASGTRGLGQGDKGCRQCSQGAENSRIRPQLAASADTTVQRTRKPNPRRRAC